MTRYIFELSAAERFAIVVELINADVSGEDFERAMSGRVCDLEDTIDVRRWAA